MEIDRLGNFLTEYIMAMVNISGKEEIGLSVCLRKDNLFKELR